MSGTIIDLDKLWPLLVGKTISEMNWYEGKVWDDIMTPPEPAWLALVFTDGTSVKLHFDTEQYGAFASVAGDWEVQL